MSIPEPLSGGLPPSFPEAQASEKSQDSCTSSIAQDIIAQQIAALRAKAPPPLPKVEEQTACSEEKATPTPSLGKGGGKGAVPKGKPGPPPAGKGGIKGAPPLPKGKAPPPPPHTPGSKVGIFDGLEKMAAVSSSSAGADKESGEMKMHSHMSRKGIDFSFSAHDRIYLPLLGEVKELIDSKEDIEKLLLFVKYSFPKKEGECFDPRETQNKGIELKGYKSGLAKTSASEMKRVLAFDAGSLLLNAEQAACFESLPAPKVAKIKEELLSCLLKPESINSSEYLDNFRSVLTVLNSCEESGKKIFLLDDFIEEPIGASERIQKASNSYKDLVEIAEAASKKETSGKEAKKAEYLKAFVKSSAFNRAQGAHLQTLIQKLKAIGIFAKDSKGKLGDTFFAKMESFSSVDSLSEEQIAAIPEWMNLLDLVKKTPKSTQLFSTVLEDLTVARCLELPLIGEVTKESLDDFFALFSEKGLFRERGIITHEHHSQFFKAFWPALFGAAKKDQVGFATFTQQIKERVETGSIRSYEELIHSLRSH